MSFGLPLDDLSVANTTHTVSGQIDAAPSLDGGLAVNGGQLGVVTVATGNTTHALASTVDSTTSSLPDTSSALPDVSGLTGTVTGAAPVGVALPDLDGVTSALPVDVDGLTGTVTGVLPNTGLL
jgi:hypothetical protein